MAGKKSEAASTTPAKPVSSEPEAPKPRVPRTPKVEVPIEPEVSVEVPTDTEELLFHVSNTRNRLENFNTYIDRLAVNMTAGEKDETKNNRRYVPRKQIKSLLGALIEAVTVHIGVNSAIIAYKVGKTVTISLNEVNAVIDSSFNQSFATELKTYGERAARRFCLVLMKDIDEKETTEEKMRENFEKETLVHEAKLAGRDPEDKRTPPVFPTDLSGYKKLLDERKLKKKESCLKFFGSDQVASELRAEYSSQNKGLKKKKSTAPVTEVKKTQNKKETKAGLFLPPSRINNILRVVVEKYNDKIRVSTNLDIYIAGVVEAIVSRICLRMKEFFDGKNLLTKKTKAKGFVQKDFFPATRTDEELMMNLQRFYFSIRNGDLPEKEEKAATV